MKWFPFSSKRSRPALSMETFKRSPGAANSQSNGVGLPGGGMSTGILRPLVVRQRTAAQEWRSFNGRWER